MLDSMIPISKTHPSARNRFILDLSSPQPELSKLTLNPFKSHQPLLRGILTEPFRRSNTPSDDDESVDSFLRRRFGGTISDLGSAGMHGIYASSSTQLSARAVMGGVYEGEREYGSVLLGMMRRGWKSEVREEKREVKEEWRAMGELGKRREGWSMYGLKGGLQSLSDRLGEAVRHSGVDIRLGEKVTGLAVDEGRVTVSRPSRAILELTKCVRTGDDEPLKPIDRSPNRRPSPSSPLPSLPAVLLPSPPETQSQHLSRRHQPRLPAPTLSDPPKWFRIPRAPSSARWESRERPGRGIRFHCTPWIG